MTAASKVNGAVGARPIDWTRAVSRDPNVVGSVLTLVPILTSLAKGTGPHTGTLFVSQAQLIEKTRLKERRVRDLMNELKDRGYLEQLRQGGYIAEGRKRASEYRLTLPSTGNPAPVGDGSQAELEYDPTGNPLPVGVPSQPAIANAAEREPTGTQGPPKREELSREKNSPQPPQSSPAALLDGEGEPSDIDADELEAQIGLFIRASAFLGDVEMPPDEGVTAAAVASVFVDGLGFQLTASERRRLVNRLRRIPEEDQLLAVVERALVGNVPDEVGNPLKFALARLDRAGKYVAEFGVPGPDPPSTSYRPSSNGKDRP